jgi:hypothetical protein
MSIFNEENDLPSSFGDHLSVHRFEWRVVYRRITVIQLSVVGEGNR